MIELHILSRNFTDYKKIKINLKFINKAELLNYLFDFNHIDSLDYIVYYNNDETNILPNLNDYSLIIRENKSYTQCSCSKKDN